MKPILFNTEMVKAILDGRKTQTRRVVKNITHSEVDLSFFDGDYATFQGAGGCQNYAATPIREYPQYKKGDILYVRETFTLLNTSLAEALDTVLFGEPLDDSHNVIYKADCKEYGKEYQKDYNVKWKPSIHMPKEYARIFLKVTNVRVEWLQDIEHEDVLSEGMDFDTYTMKDTKKLYSDDTHGEVDYCEDLANEWWINLWNSTSKDGYKWEDNPYVFVYEFERVEQPDA